MILLLSKESEQTRLNVLFMDMCRFSTHEAKDYFQQRQRPRQLHASEQLQ